MKKVLLKEIKYYFDSVKNEIIFKNWLNKQEKNNIILIRKRIDRLSNGNYGDYKSVGDGVLELRFKQGFRIYFTEIGDIIILLFCGGNKSSQKKDIEKAKEYKFILDKYGLENCIKI